MGCLNPLTPSVSRQCSWFNVLYWVVYNFSCALSCLLQLSTLSHYCVPRSVVFLNFLSAFQPFNRNLPFKGTQIALGVPLSSAFKLYLFLTLFTTPFFLPCHHRTQQRAMLNIHLTVYNIITFTLFQMTAVETADCPKFLHKGAICECIGFGKHVLRI